MNTSLGLASRILPSVAVVVVTCACATAPKQDDTAELVRASEERFLSAFRDHDLPAAWALVASWMKSQSSYEQFIAGPEDMDIRPKSWRIGKIEPFVPEDPTMAELGLTWYSVQVEAEMHDLKSQRPPHPDQWVDLWVREADGTWAWMWRVL